MQKLLILIKIIKKPKGSALKPIWWGNNPGPRRDSLYGIFLAKCEQILVKYSLLRKIPFWPVKFLFVINFQASK